MQLRSTTGPEANHAARVDLTDCDRLASKTQATSALRPRLFQKIRRRLPTRHKTMADNKLARDTAEESRALAQPKQSSKYSSRARSRQILLSITRSSMPRQSRDTAPKKSRKHRLVRLSNLRPKNTASTKKPARSARLWNSLLFKSDLAIHADKALIAMRIRRFYRHCLRGRVTHSPGQLHDKSGFGLALSLYEQLFRPCGDASASASDALFESLIANLDVLLYMLLESFVDCSATGSARVARVCRVLTASLKAFPQTLPGKQERFMFAFSLLQDICAYFFGCELALLRTAPKSAQTGPREVALGDSTVWPCLYP